MLLLLLFLSSTAQAYHHLPRDLQGPYCSTRVGGCCPGRIDDCSVPILGTLCYCDTFCNRTDNPDCCPDYTEACLGGYSEGAPEEVVVGPGCTPNNGDKNAVVETINCNQCTCTASKLTCSQDPCLVNPTQIEKINAGHYTWTARNHTDFWGRKLEEGVVFRLGTLEPESGVKSMKPMKYVYSRDSLPSTFDARVKWPNLMQNVKDQGWCGSDWAFTIADVIADRLAIQSLSLETLSLSPQHLLSCSIRGQQGCNGGHLDKGWNFMRKFGITPTPCYPYTSGTTGVTGKCKISHKTKSMTEVSHCHWSNDAMGEERELYRSQPAYRISSREDDVRHEISTFGPVMAVMSVTPDFFTYGGGIYQDPRLSEKRGWHSIRIIGWGEESIGGEVVKYWLCSNTWGDLWGESGLFRILRGVNECDIESFVVAAWARTGVGKSFRKERPF